MYYDDWNCCDLCDNCIYKNLYSRQNYFEHIMPTVASVKIVPLSVKEKHIKSSTPDLIVDLRIPIIDGMKNAAFQRDINKEFENDVTEFKNQMEEAAREKEIQERGRRIKSKPYVVSTVYQVTYDKNDILSVSILYQELIGGKNNYIKATYNYDLNKGKALALRDLFKSDADYKTLINSEIKKQINANPGKYFPGTAENFKGIANDQPFYLEDGNLVVFFGFNEIAPTEAELPVFRIPFSTLGDSLKPAFR